MRLKQRIEQLEQQEEATRNVVWPSPYGPEKNRHPLTAEEWVAKHCKPQSEDGQ